MEPGFLGTHAGTLWASSQGTLVGETARTKVGERHHHERGTEDFGLYPVAIAMAMLFGVFLGFFCNGVGWVFGGFGHTHKMWTFPGLGSNLHHSSDNSKSLTTRPTGNSQVHFFFSLFLGPHPWDREVPRLGIGAAVAGLRHSHSHTGSKPHLQPTPQLKAMLDS